MPSSKIALSCRLIAIYAGFLFATGCSVADYKKPIGELNNAIHDSVTTVEKIDKEATRSQNARWRKLITANQAFLLTPGDSCASGNKTCELVIRIKGDSIEKPFPVLSLIPNALVGLSALKGYVANLENIVNANTAAAVTTRANEALVSVSKIETQIANAMSPGGKPPSNIEAYSEPLIASLKWLVNQYVERLKYKALAASTSRAQPIIQSLADYHQATASAAATLKTASTYKLFVISQAEYDDAKTKTDGQISAYLKSAEAYNAALKSQSADPLKRFVEAHRILNRSLNGEGDASLTDVVSAIKDFKDVASEFKKIVRNINEKKLNRVGV